ncbi:ligand-gated channel [Rhizobium sp. Root708]|uniref:TonB-dependent siderophore receptor n=1 Tax=Rhizobium sp. Root708 TaxID=1736592 RepID=UPI0006F461B9|nr:TonB-dependent siderophore receptor [Rhizobium sp. Root708]KRB58381.1 ligand-gated channel [Rhizobium sp. Root708]
MHIERIAGRLTGSRHRSRKMSLLGCTALIAFMPTFSYGEDAGTSGSETTLSPIVLQGVGIGLDLENDSKSIVARKTTAGGAMATDILDIPASVSVITSKEIEERGAQNVEQVLQYTSGVTTDFYGSDDRFDYFKIRGFDANMYRDGLLIGSPFGGLREEPYAYERVEVLKGANSSGFGASDPGGSVNYVTKRPKSERFGEVYATGGSYSHGETGFDFGDNITADDTLSYRITGKFQRSDDEYDYSQNDENFITGGVTWRPSGDTNLSVIFDHLDRDGVPGSGGHPVGSNFSRSRFFGEPDFNYRDINRNAVNILFDHDFGDGLTFNANARYSKSRSNFGYAYISATPTSGSTIADRAYFANDSSDEQFIVDTHLQYDASFEDIDNRTLLGLEYNDYSKDSASYWGGAPGIDWTNPVYTGAPTSVPIYANTRNDQKTKAIYLQEELTFFDKLIATVGLRNDWLDLDEANKLDNTAKSGDFSEFTKRFGLTYKLTDEFSAYASYAESAAPPQIGTAPETGKQYEIGVKYAPTDFPAIFSAAVYDLTKENITVTDSTTLLQSTVGKVRNRGVDLEAKAEVTNNVNVIAAYSYIDSKIVENGTGGNEGKRLALVPTHFASAWVTYTLEGNGPRGDMTFGLGSRYTGSYYMSDANTSKSKGNVVFDASFNYKIQENTTFQLNVSNLFDEKHVAYGGFGADFYNPGRAIYATLRQTW